MKYLFHLNLISLAQRWSELHLSWLMLKHENLFMLRLQQRDTRRLSYQTQPAAFSSLILTGFKAQKQQTVSIKTWWEEKQVSNLKLHHKEKSGIPWTPIMHVSYTTYWTGWYVTGPALLKLFYFQLLVKRTLLNEKTFSLETENKPQFPAVHLL